MAIQLMYILNRNYDSSDQTTSNFSTIMTSDVPEPQSAEDLYTVQLTPSIESLEWSNKPGHTFKEWNTKRDGSGDSYSVGVHLQMAGDYDNQHNLFAIWQLMNLSKIKLNGITYDIKDAVARAGMVEAETMANVTAMLAEYGFNTSTTLSQAKAGTAQTDSAVVT